LEGTGEEVEKEAGKERGGGKRQRRKASSLYFNRVARCPNSIANQVVGIN
jgi:hypothetical protein